MAIADEFRQCRTCGYDRGFHTSLHRIAAGHPHFRVVLICPECGTRYDARWVMEL
ncbi:MAG: hypothetical protein A4E39_01171 [Methanoregulaceae archaeon PtaB.Bin152]|nr:MAG: hypothetical protein A4E39_01171 [Methanoregulaceae archaeon PtaB.Bin152]